TNPVTRLFRRRHALRYLQFDAGDLERIAGSELPAFGLHGRAVHTWWRRASEGNEYERGVAAAHRGHLRPDAADREIVLVDHNLATRARSCHHPHKRSRESPLF